MFVCLQLWFCVSACAFLLQDNRVKIVRSLDTVQVYNPNKINIFMKLLHSFHSQSLTISVSLTSPSGVFFSSGAGWCFAEPDGGGAEMTRPWPRGRPWPRRMMEMFFFGALSSFLTYKHGTLKLGWKVLLYIYIYDNWFQSIKMSRFK